jgi:hypothetical protein
VAATGVAALLAAAAALLGVTVRSGTPAAVPAPAPPPAARSTMAPASVDNWVVAENRRRGTGAWRLSHLGGAHAVEGWADHVSAARGQRVRLFVSTTAARFRVEAYRMGWYGGLGARLVWRSAALAGRRQPPPVRTPGTNLLTCRWRPSLQVTVGAAWPPGDYLFKLVASGAAGGQRYLPLTVRDDHARAALVVQNDVTTWQAYNPWGGRNLYWGPGRSLQARSRVVSFDRPYAPAGLGAGDFLGNEYPLVRLVERLGLDVTYWTDVDLHQHPGRLLGQRALVSLGHDEYWSTRMRHGAEQARAHGVNLAFLGANAVFRHIRLRPSPAGPDREEVNYKPWSATDDPAWRTDPQAVTTDWRQPPLRDPESRLLGAMYQCNPVHAAGLVTAAGARSWLLAGARVRAGERLPGLVGDEYDRLQAGWPRPPGVRLLLHSPVRCHGRAGFADATYYTWRASGAGVFDAGTGSWVCQLDRACTAGRRSARTAQVVRAVTTNLLRAFALGPAGRHRGTAAPAGPAVAARPGGP